MATRLRPGTARLYDEDFYVWTEAQAELLRARRFEELDLDNLIEEVEALGRAERSKVLNNASVIVEHLLKLQHSPTHEPRAGWSGTILEHRDRLENDLTPRLRQILAGELPHVYRQARRRAAHALRQHGERSAADALPETCPYTVEQIIEDWWP